MNDAINGLYAFVECRALRVGELAAGEGSDVLEGSQQITPPVREGRGQRVPTQNRPERGQASTITPPLNKRLQGVEQLGIVGKGHTGDSSMVAGVHGLW
jgi:hypothetical protein